MGVGLRGIASWDLALISCSGAQQPHSAIFTVVRYADTGDTLPLHLSAMTCSVCSASNREQIVRALGTRLTNELSSEFRAHGLSGKRLSMRAAAPNPLRSREFSLETPIFRDASESRILWFKQLPLLCYRSAVNLSENSGASRAGSKYARPYAPPYPGAYLAWARCLATPRDRRVEWVQRCRHRRVCCCYFAPYVSLVTGYNKCSIISGTPFKCRSCAWRACRLCRSA